MRRVIVVLARRAFRRQLPRASLAAAWRRDPVVWVALDASQQDFSRGLQKSTLHSVFRLTHSATVERVNLDLD